MFTTKFKNLKKSLETSYQSYNSQPNITFCNAKLLYENDINIKIDKNISDPLYSYKANVIKLNKLINSNES